MNYMNTYNENINATYDSNLTKLGVVDYSNPTKISLYASSFDGKEKLSDLITSYNKKQTKSNVITYNDFIGNKCCKYHKLCFDCLCICIAHCI